MKPCDRRRRSVCVTLAALAVPLASSAQQPSRTYRVGLLCANTADTVFLPLIREELRKYGFEEGRNLAFKIGEVKGQAERAPALANEMAEGGVDAIIADLPRQILAARRATSTIPIVMMFGMVPRELGLIQSLSRPGGNVTGTLIQGPDASGKTIQLVREVLSQGARLAMLYQGTYPGLGYYVDELDRAARTAGLRPIAYPVETDADVDRALADIGKRGAEAMLVTPTGPVFRGLERILTFASAKRIAVISPTKWLVQEGALMAFEPDLPKLVVRTAAITAKILNGTKPADIPVEAPTTYELWINLASAQAVGIKIPSAVRLQASRVFE